MNGPKLPNGRQRSSSFRYACAVTNTPIPASVFNGIPGPTPWYLRPTDPAVEGFHWEQTHGKWARRGKTFLVGNVGVVAVLDFYNYVMRLDPSTLLIWNQRSGSKYEGSPPVNLVVVRPSLLPSFGDKLDSEIARMETEGMRLALSGRPVVAMNLNTGVIGENLTAAFPKELKAVDELLILCTSSAIARQDGSGANLALLVANPRLSSFSLYPQDWFNSADLDFGYQWVTRIARDPQTGRVRGEGFRIDPFELDGTLRNALKAG